MGIRFEGVEEITEAFEKIASIENMKTSMQKACALVEGEAREKAPKDTGDLRRSIESRVEVDGGSVVGIVAAPLEYAAYVEFGTGKFADKGGRKDVPWCYQDEQGDWHSTSGQRPQPFLHPALRENREKVKRILREGMNND